MSRPACARRTSTAPRCCAATCRCAGVRNVASFTRSRRSAAAKGARRVRGGLLGAALGVPRHAGRRQAGRHVARRGARAADGLRRAPDHCLQLRQVAAGLRPAHPEAAIERQLLLARVHTSRRAAGAPRPPCWRLSGVQVHRGAACAGACMAPVLPRRSASGTRSSTWSRPAMAAGCATPWFPAPRWGDSFIHPRSYGERGLIPGSDCMPASR